MSIDISYYSRLARLKIPDEKMPEYSEKCNSILKLIEKLPPVENGEIEFVPRGEILQLRHDVVSESAFIDHIMLNSMTSDEGFLEVPRAIK